MDEPVVEGVVEEKGNTCAFCNKETALAVFGILIGIVFIAMSVDTLRRMRMIQEIPND